MQAMAHTHLAYQTAPVMLAYTTRQGKAGPIPGGSKCGAGKLHEEMMAAATFVAKLVSLPGK